MKRKFLFLPLLFWIIVSDAYSQDGLIPAFPLNKNNLELHKLAQPGKPFDKVGHRFAILGDQSGSFEAWAYPLKLFRNFEFSFFLESATRPIPARNIVQDISVTPEATVISYVYQSFTIKAIYVTPVDEPAALILLQVNSTEPLSIVCGFLPVLQPMWPAGIGGQYAYWNKELKAYLISEPTRQNHGLIGCPAAQGVSATPAHMLSDSPNEFKIEINKPEKFRDKYIPIYMTGGKEERQKIIERYEKLQENPEKFYQENYRYYQNLKQTTLQIETPEPDLDLAYEWAKVAYDNLIVDNPTLGKGLVAGLDASGTSGRPGFGWFFGGDAYMNMLSLNSYGYFSAVRNALTFTQKWQREDGKMAHELSQAEGYINWWKDYPYGYIHGDTTPFYIVAMADYYRMTGDLPFIKESWNSLKKAYQWCQTTDAKGDGLMDNQKAGLGASEYGALTGIETDVYLGAVWTRATQDMQFLAEAVGDKRIARTAARDSQRAINAFRDKFWYPDGGFYAYAFNSRGEHVKEISPWLSVGLMWNLGTPEKTGSSLEKLNSADLTTDWGVSLLSRKSEYFNPVGYNYGAIWPFVTGWVAMAQFQHHNSLQGYQLLQANHRHTFTDQPGMMPEVFSGMFNIPLEESVSHQGFSSGGVVLPLVRGLFGLHGDAITKEIEFAPQFPASWKNARAENYQVGKEKFSLRYVRNEDVINCALISEDAKGYHFRFAPTFGPGTLIRQVTVNGKETDYTVTEFTQNQPVFDVPIDQPELNISVNYEPTVELLPPDVETGVGEINKGLKIISIHREGQNLQVNVEGISGSVYQLSVTNPELINDISGATIAGNIITLAIPDSLPGKFLPYHINLNIKAYKGE
jgi:glycogen debranching enzyme